ncbi:MAG TPA: RNA-binding protein, partial [Stellaceae bacterium]|nr:RNA-binding protein [Stellaceae bacterium]
MENTAAARGDAVQGDDGLGKTGPHRRCIATGEIADRAQLLRFVVGPGGEIVPDVAANLPGRGLWLTPRRDALERAAAKRLFARAARRPVVLPPGLADRVEFLLAQRCCDAIGLARRAGLAVAGFEKVGEAVRAGKVAVLLSALDGAEGGRNKFRALRRDLPLATVLTSAEMGGVFGRDHVVNVALGGGRLSRRLLADAEKIAGFRSGAVVDRGAEPAASRRVR